MGMVNYGPKYPSWQERLRLNLPKSLPRHGCWLWQGNLDSHGYGYLTVNGKMMRGHRAAYLQANGDLPADKIICHKCDNPRCCNPDHLYAGTHKDNMQDCWDRKRHKNYGENHNAAKLTRADVDAIRKAYAKGNVLMSTLAEKYGVSEPHIGGILSGKYWKRAAPAKVVYRRGKAHRVV